MKVPEALRCYLCAKKAQHVLAGFRLCQGHGARVLRIAADAGVEAPTILRNDGRRMAVGTVRFVTRPPEMYVP